MTFCKRKLFAKPIVCTVLGIALVVETSVFPGAMCDGHAPWDTHSLAPKSQAEDIGTELGKIRYHLSHRPDHSLGARRQIIDRAHGGRYAIFEISAAGVKQDVFSNKVLEGYEHPTKIDISDAILKRLKLVQDFLAKNASQTIEHPFTVFIVPSHISPKTALHPHLLDLHHADDRWYASLISPDFVKMGAVWHLQGVFVTLDLLLDDGRRESLDWQGFRPLRAFLSVLSRLRSQRLRFFSPHAHACQ